MLASGISQEILSQENPTDDFLLLDSSGSRFFCENSSLPPLGCILEAARDEGTSSTCDLITEIAEFPLYSEGKCYGGVITLPSMCDLQDRRREFPKGPCF